MKPRAAAPWVAGFALVASQIALAGPLPDFKCEPEAFRKPARGLTGLVVETFDTCGGEERMARLREVTFRRFAKKKMTLAVLPCKDSSVGTDNPDEPSIALECQDPQVVDAGYRIRITRPDFAGVRSAFVSRKSMFGEVDLAALVCAAF